MIKMHMNPDRLSLDELRNISTLLRGPCIDCVERDVPDDLRHSDEVRRFLSAMADVIDNERDRRIRKSGGTA